MPTPMPISCRCSGPRRTSTTSWTVMTCSSTSPSSSPSERPPRALRVPSEAIRGHPRPSEAIRGPSEGHQRARPLVGVPVLSQPSDGLLTKGTDGSSGGCPTTPRHRHSATGAGVGRWPPRPPVYPTARPRASGQLHGALCRACTISRGLGCVLILLYPSLVEGRTPKCSLTDLTPLTPHTGPQRATQCTVDYATCRALLRPSLS